MRWRGWRRLGAVGLGLAMTTAAAQLRYGAPIDGTAQELWSHTDSKLACALIHEIPGFGHAQFNTYAGRVLKSSVQIEPQRGINADSLMRFVATRPEWQSGGHEILLGKVRLYRGFPPYAGGTLAGKILTALQHGQQILMPYTDETYAAGQNIVPALSPLGFEPAYRQYLRCQQQLLRVNYADVQMLPLAFKYQERELTTESQRRMQDQLDYLKEDRAVNEVVIRANAYDMRNKSENVNMAAERGEALRKMYLDAGIAEELITVVKFNALSLPRERDYATPNHAVTARNALVALGRDESLVDRNVDANAPDVGARSDAP